ncbi:hypothetical protein [Nitrosopumilus sp.]|uniref:hypothetical protein n=1 Tax=Nitrosopumilus sp. TaxID=2024843 RepID=UPI00292DE647|nr:hypothetical protein [Nitrosopumilus sp.]
MQKILLLSSIILTSIIMTYVTPVYAASPLGFDKATYTWTDKIFITIVAPDFDFDVHSIDEIGNDSFNPIKISTRGHTLDQYKLVETGPSTGIFTGEIILTGFCHDADGNTNTGVQSRNSSECSVGDDTNPRTEPSQNGGPTNGFLEADNDDGITISFEYTENETILGSAPIRWIIGDVQWLEASYPSTGTGIIRVIDPDMNLNPETVDNLVIDVWSDSDAGGIDLTVTETGEMTGVFEGTVFFSTTNESSGSRLLIGHGDTVTAEYEDNTLPNPYTIADELDVTATTIIGTVVPPLERISMNECKTVDSFGNELTNVLVNQQIQITCDLTNGQDKEQQFAYLVQIKKSDGDMTVHLSWITGTLLPGQKLSSSLSWNSQIFGMYDATMFVWESLDDPISLTSPVSLTVNVN